MGGFLLTHLTCESDVLCKSVFEYDVFMYWNIYLLFIDYIK